MCEISFLDLGRARSGGAIDNWRPEAGTDACRMPSDGWFISPTVSLPLRQQPLPQVSRLVWLPHHL
jgi:hypothetical protein